MPYGYIITAQSHNTCIITNYIRKQDGIQFEKIDTWIIDEQILEQGVQKDPCRVILHK